MFIGYSKTTDNLAFINLVSTIKEHSYPELEYVEAEFVEPELKQNQRAKAYWDKQQQKVVWNIITLQYPTLEEDILANTNSLAEDNVAVMMGLVDADKKIATTNDDTLALMMGLVEVNAKLDELKRLITANGVV